MAGSSNAGPTAWGVQSAMFTPLGTKMKAMRRGKPGAVPGLAAKESAGTIDSSIGSAIAAPSPLRKVRRGNCHCLVMGIIFALKLTKLTSNCFKDNAIRFLLPDVRDIVSLHLLK